MKYLAHPAIVVALALLCGAPTVAAQSPQPGQGSGTTVKAIDVDKAPRPATQATRAIGPIRIDAKLDEPSWEQAPEITDFIQGLPDTGMPATQRTVAKILYDDKNIYVSAICYEPHPERIIIKTLQKELPNLSTHELDLFGVYFDTYLDRRDSFLWLINPLGAYRDGQSFNDSRSLNFGWNGLCEVSGRITPEAWIVELRVPWTTLRFDPKGNQDWGLNVFRRIKWRNEETFWAPLGLRDRGHRMSKAGTLKEVDAVKSGRNLVFKPYTLAKHSGGPAGIDPGGHFNAGLDFKYGVTPRMTADLTFRTDFSDVDVDKQIVNLTRFPIFFDELRDFFIENAGTFQFGDVTERNYRTGSSTNNFTLFNSRQIGLKSGTPVPIFGGGRLTGRAGDFQIGLLDVQTERFQGDPAENFAVARARRYIGGSDIGFMFSNRQATGEGANNKWNRTYGVDANISLGTSLKINSYFAGTSEPGKKTDNKAGRVAVGYRDALWDIGGYAKQVGASFNPGIGFVQRKGMRDLYGTFGLHPRPKIPRILEINPYVEGHHITQLETDSLESRNVVGGFDVSLVDGSVISSEVGNNFERLFVPFAVKTNVYVPPGDYTFNEAAIKFTTNPGPALWGNVGVSGGGYYGGHRTTISGQVTWELNYRLSFFGSLERNALTLQGQSFPANVYGARIKYSPNVKVFLGAYVQYNHATGQVVTNLRMDWLYSPLSDLYVVYTERRDVEGRGIQEKYVTVKLTKYLQF